MSYRILSYPMVIIKYPIRSAWHIHHGIPPGIKHSHVWSPVFSAFHWCPRFPCGPCSVHVGATCFTGDVLQRFGPSSEAGRISASAMVLEDPLKSKKSRPSSSFSDETPKIIENPMLYQGLSSCSSKIDWRPTGCHFYRSGGYTATGTGETSPKTWAPGAGIVQRSIGDFMVI